LISPSDRIFALCKNPIRFIFFAALGALLNGILHTRLEKIRQKQQQIKVIVLPNPKRAEILMSKISVQK
jgi:hypothetical protein